MIRLSHGGGTDAKWSSGKRDNAQTPIISSPRLAAERKSSVGCKQPGTFKQPMIDAKIVALEQDASSPPAGVEHSSVGGGEGAVEVEVAVEQEEKENEEKEKEEKDVLVEGVRAVHVLVADLVHRHSLSKTEVQTDNESSGSGGFGEGGGMHECGSDVGERCTQASSVSLSLGKGEQNFRSASTFVLSAHVWGKGSHRVSLFQQKSCLFVCV
jgi:hypothetical protein